MNLIVFIDFEGFHNNPHAVAMQAVIFCIWRPLFLVFVIHQIRTYKIIIVFDDNFGKRIVVMFFLLCLFVTNLKRKNILTNSSILWILTSFTSFLSRNMNAEK